MTESPRLCLVEDDAIMRASLCQRFKLESIDCDCFIHAGEAVDALAQRDYAALISDIRLPPSRSRTAAAADHFHYRLRDH
jgi:two-component system C4-dicarboxylate transport response regulator DctD